MQVTHYVISLVCILHAAEMEQINNGVTRASGVGRLQGATT